MNAVNSPNAPPPCCAWEVAGGATRWERPPIPTTRFVAAPLARSPSAEAGYRRIPQAPLPQTELRLRPGSGFASESVRTGTGTGSGPGSGSAPESVEVGSVFAPSNADLFGGDRMDHAKEKKAEKHEAEREKLRR